LVGDTPIERNKRGTGHVMATMNVSAAAQFEVL
jgi:hypothetical protein